MGVTESDAPWRLLATIISDKVSDPRVARTRKHALSDVVIMALLATIAGADGWSDIESFCRSRRSWIDEVLSPAGGLPSADTFRRVLCRLNPNALHAVFVEWVVRAIGTDQSEHIAIDGKTARGSASPSKGGNTLHLVSAWATDLGVTLGQVATEVKSNEITAIPELLDTLNLVGATVTIDAMGCQREIARKIRGKQGNYILQVKGNQPSLLEEVAGAFVEADATPAHSEHAVAAAVDETVDGDHGRVERRKVTAIENVGWLTRQNRWAGVKSIVKVERERELLNPPAQKKNQGAMPEDGEPRSHVSSETSYYITSLSADAAELGTKIRNHWHIESAPQAHGEFRIGKEEHHELKLCA